MSRVALIGENSIEYVNTLIDIWNNGDCAVLIDWRIPFQSAQQMMNEAGVNTCYIDKRIFDKSPHCTNNEICYVTYKSIDAHPRLAPESLYQKYRSNYSHDEAIVIYSSGTTGSAKGVILSHYAISKNADAIIDYMKPNPTDCMYIVKTISHLSSITGELVVALKTHTPLLIAPIIVPPRIILQNINQYNITKICINPTILKMILNEHERKLCDISSLHEIYVHGAKTNELLGERARNSLSTSNIYFEYGLTEAGPRVSSQKVNNSRNTSTGKPISGVTIAIVNEEGKLLDPLSKGIIHVYTPSTFSGYVRGDKRLPSLYKDWLNTGDIGYVNEEGELFVTGRLDDVINIDAHKIYPNDVAAEICKHANIDECIVTLVHIHNADTLCCLYTASNDIDNNIKNSLGKFLMKYEIPKIFIRTDSLPRTRTGKASAQLAKEIIIRELERIHS